MENWEKILVAVMAAGLVFFLWPSLRHSMKNAPKAEKGDWSGLIFIMGLVVLFVLLLIKLV